MASSMPNLSHLFRFLSKSFQKLQNFCLLQIATVLLQITTKCYYKLRHLVYYKLRQRYYKLQCLLQIATQHQRCF